MIQQCERCNGRGMVEVDGEMVTCPACEGKRYTVEEED